MVYMKFLIGFNLQPIWQKSLEVSLNSVLSIYSSEAGEHQQFRILTNRLAHQVRKSNAVRNTVLSTLKWKGFYSDEIKLARFLPYSTWDKGKVKKTFNYSNCIFRSGFEDHRKVVYGTNWSSVWQHWRKLWPWRSWSYAVRTNKRTSCILDSFCSSS
jgi:uncharacterized protein YihD (DUF1040 family)